MKDRQHGFGVFLDEHVELGSLKWTLSFETWRFSLVALGFGAMEISLADPRFPCKALSIWPVQSAQAWFQRVTRWGSSFQGRLVGRQNFSGKLTEIR